MGLSKTKAFVFSSHPFGENDKRVILLTKDFGKVVAIAPHAKKSKRRFGAGLESLTLVEALFFEKQNRSLVRLEEVHILHSYSILKANLQKIAYGSYFLDLTSHLIGEKESFEELFHFLEAALNTLEKGTYPDAVLSRYFEARILSPCGWRPQLLFCLKCREELKKLSSPIYFSISDGGIVCSSCMLHQQRSPLYIPVTQEGLTYLERVMEGKRVPNTHPAIHQQMSQILPPFLFHQLGKELKSYRFIQTVCFE